MREVYEEQSGQIRTWVRQLITSATQSPGEVSPPTTTGNRLEQRHARKASRKSDKPLSSYT